MLTQERPVVARELPVYATGDGHRDTALGQQVPRSETAGSGLLVRLLLVGVGFGLAFTGWMLVMTVFLVFIGLPMFFFGLALMQAQER